MIAERQGLYLHWLSTILGFLLVVAGLATFPLPIPIGLPLLMIGIPILTRHSSWAKRVIHVLARRFPLLRKLIHRDENEAGEDRNSNDRLKP